MPPRGHLGNVRVRRVADHPQPGEVVVAPTPLGEISVIQLDGTRSWMCAGSSYLACGTDVGLASKWQGLGGFLSGEGLFFLEASGRAYLRALSNALRDSPAAEAEHHLRAADATETPTP